MTVKSIFKLFDHILTSQVMTNYCLNKHVHIALKLYDQMIEIILFIFQVDQLSASTGSLNKNIQNNVIT